MEELKEVVLTFTPRGSPGLIVLLGGFTKKNAWKVLQHDLFKAVNYLHSLQPYRERTGSSYIQLI
jgi:hypothetical protein